MKLKLILLFSFCVFYGNGITQEIDLSNLDDKKIALEAQFDSLGILTSFIPTLDGVDISEFVIMSGIILKPEAQETGKLTATFIRKGGVVLEYNIEFISSHNVSYFYAEFKLKVKSTGKSYAFHRVELPKDSLLNENASSTSPNDK